MRKQKLIPRLYRITKEQDNFIKKVAKLEKVSEGAVIRLLIHSSIIKDIRFFIS